MLHITVGYEGIVLNHKVKSVARSRCAERIYKNDELTALILVDYLGLMSPNQKYRVRFIRSSFWWKESTYFRWYYQCI